MQRDRFAFLFGNLLLSLPACFNPADSSLADGVEAPETTGELPIATDDGTLTTSGDAGPASSDGSTGGEPAPLDGSSTGDVGSATDLDATTGEVVPGTDGGTTGSIEGSTGEPIDATTGAPLDPFVVVTVDDLGLAIPDDGYDGTIESMGCAELDIDDPRDVETVSMQIAMAHTFVGDLVIKVVPPDGPIVTALMRPGVPEPFDGDIPPSGNGSGTDLDPSGPILFGSADSDVSAEDMGATLPGAGRVCLDDGICFFRANAGVNAPAGDITALTGVAGAGTWRVCFGDATLGDTGSVDRVTLSLRMQ